MLKITLTADQVQELINELQGTIKTLNSALRELFNINDWYDLSDNSLAEIESEIFDCDNCGWWYEIAEMSDQHQNKICKSCKEDYIEQDEY